MDNKKTYKLLILPLIMFLLTAMVFVTTPDVKSSNEAETNGLLYSLEVASTELDMQSEPDADFSPEVEDHEMIIRIENLHNKTEKVPQTEPIQSDPEEETSEVKEETKETVNEEIEPSEPETTVEEETTEQENQTNEEATTNEEVVHPNEDTNTPNHNENTDDNQNTNNENTEDKDTIDEQPNEDNKETDEDNKEVIVDGPVAEITPEKFTPMGSYARPDFTIYNDDEKTLLELILNKIEENKNTDINEEIIDVPFSMDINSYYKVASYFYVYYGQKLAVDETFDLINHYDYNKGTMKTQLRMRYKDIRKFEADMEAVKLKADEILTSFNDGTEEELLFQISEYLRNNIVYTEDYYDLQHALINGTSVCNGYALAFNLLTNRAGIKSDICIGKVPGSGYHAWNRVTLSDGSQYFYDITFLDSKNPNYKYIHSSTALHTNNYLINNYVECWMGR